MTGTLDERLREIIREEVAAAIEASRVPPAIYTTGQAATALGCSRSMIDKLIRERKLRAFKVGSLTRVAVEDLQAYLASLAAA